LWERAGVSALHIEDQMFPKSCAQTHSVALASADTMCERLSAMLDARRNADMWLIARTDAMLCETAGEVLDRCKKYAAAGADALFINTPQSIEKFSYIARGLEPLNLPLIFNAVRSTHTPDVDDKTLHLLGVRVVLHPVAAMVEACQRMSEVYSALVQRQSVSSTQGLANLTTLIKRSALVDV
jgi:2,3-dimethylmalate lyase